MANPEKLTSEINQLHAENISNAQRTAENAIIIGVKFHQLKEALPHGEFEETSRKSCKVSDQTRGRYMNLAEERMIEKIALKLLTAHSNEITHSGKSSTVELLADPELQAIPSEFRDQARDQVRADQFKWSALEVKPKELVRGLEGKEIGELYRLYNIIREKKPKQFTPVKELTPEEQIAAENAQAEALYGAMWNGLAAIEMDLGSKEGICATRISPAKWKELHRKAVGVNKLIKPLLKRKSGKAEKTQEKPAKAFGWDVTVVFQPASGKEDKTFHWRGCSEKAARRKGLLQANAQAIRSVSPVTQEEWVRAYGIGKM